MRFRISPTLFKCARPPAAPRYLSTVCLITVEGEAVVEEPFLILSRGDELLAERSKFLNLISLDHEIRYKRTSDIHQRWGHHHINDVTIQLASSSANSRFAICGRLAVCCLRPSRRLRYKWSR